MSKPISVLAFLLLVSAPVSLSTASKPKLDPVPADWPHQFHSLLFMNRSGALQKIDLWYDWPNGRNFNIIQGQLGDLVTYDLEWNNGTSFIYTLDPSPHQCQVVNLSVGILRPNWLDGADYLGQEVVDNFLCNVWEKADFIVYYEDVLTRRPVKWIFYSGYTAHVMTFEVGAVLDDPNWQAPVYCFSEAEKERRRSSLLELGGSFGMLMRGMADAADDINNQLHSIEDDLEWDNGTSFYYSLDPSKKECRVTHFPVGTLRPNWLDGATYLGQEMIDNFLCNVWTKVDFMLYYEDVLTRRPVKWIFFEGPPGCTAHVMTFEVGAVLEDPNWQAPVYCFS